MMNNSRTTNVVYKIYFYNIYYNLKNMNQNTK